VNVGVAVAAGDELARGLEIVLSRSILVRVRTCYRSRIEDRKTRLLTVRRKLTVTLDYVVRSGTLVLSKHGGHEEWHVTYSYCDPVLT
jgi:hypothetical protein